jgi:uncharacterized membrane protein ArfC
VNWWLMAVAFTLGLVLTGSFMVGRVTRAVPVEAPASDVDVGEDLAGENVDPKVAEPRVPEPKVPEPRVVEPHGPGSARPGADGTGPEGWLVKANEESRLYHSPESPSFGVTRGEVWFRDVETAEAAGFNRWDSGKSQRGLR